MAGRRSVSLRTASVLAVLIAAVGVSGAAYAYWTSSGTGQGSATTGTLTFQVTALVGTDASDAQAGQPTTLIPNDSATAILRVTNPNSLTVHVTAITGGTPTATGGCPVNNVTFTNPSSFAAAQYTIAGNASVLLTLPAAVFMNAAAPKECMGATFSFPVTVTVQT